MMHLRKPWLLDWLNADGVQQLRPCWTLGSAMRFIARQPTGRYVYLIRSLRDRSIHFVVS